MPVYQYACRDCGNRFEKRQSFHDDPLSICPECQGGVQRVINPVGIIFKGAGFYINDSKNGRNGVNGSNASDNKSKSNGVDSSIKSGDAKSKDAKPKKEAEKTKATASG